MKPTPNHPIYRSVFDSSSTSNPTDVLSNHPIPRDVADTVKRQPHVGEIDPAAIERANQPRPPAGE